MRQPASFAVGILVALLAVLGAGCASDSGDREGGESPHGRAGRRMAREGRPQPDQIWKAYDLNGDGKITRGEFMAVRATCFAKYDANDEGMLSREQIRKFSPPQLRDRIDAAFSRLDLDGDGLISREEFARESDRLFRQLDTNGDGIIAGNELSNVIPAVLGDLCLPTNGRSPGPSAPR